MSVLEPYWFNGSLREGPEVPLPVGDRAFLLGDGAFETLAVFNGVAVDLDAHIGRLVKAADLLDLTLTREAIFEATEALLLAHKGCHAVMRITASGGSANRGLAADERKPVIMATLAGWTKGTLNRPARLVTATTRRNENSPASRLKLISYADNIIAAREAKTAGADDALMLNSRDKVACTTIANVVASQNGKLFTPPPEDGALGGIVLSHLDATYKSMTLNELCRMDGLFLTNSIRLVRPVVSIDGIPVETISATTIAKVFEQFCNRIQAQCGIDPRLVDAP